jgi:hypothetical protein
LREEPMKKMASMGLGFITFLFSILIFRECLAGVMVEQLMRDKEGNASKVVLYFSENKFRTDHPDGNMTTIIDFQGDRMVMIDHQSKVYVEVRFSQWEKEVAEGLKKSTPKIKTTPRKITVKGTGETATINGFRTEKIEIIANGELIEENWVTRDVDLKDVENVMEKIALVFSKEFRTEMKEGREIYDKLKTFGFPILVRDYTMTYGLKAMDVLEVKKMEKKQLMDEIFFPPRDYQKIVPEPSKK